MKYLQVMQELKEKSTYRKIYKAVIITDSLANEQYPGWKTVAGKAWRDCWADRAFQSTL